MFIVEIIYQKNYLFYKKTMIDVFTVSTGSKTRYKGNREIKKVYGVLEDEWIKA